MIDRALKLWMAFRREAVGKDTARQARALLARYRWPRSSASQRKAARAVLWRCSKRKLEFMAQQGVDLVAPVWLHCTRAKLFHLEGAGSWELYLIAYCACPQCLLLPRGWLPADQCNGPGRRGRCCRHSRARVHMLQRRRDDFRCPFELRELSSTCANGNAVLDITRTTEESTGISASEVHTSF